MKESIYMIQRIILNIQAEIPFKENCCNNLRFSPHTNTYNVKYIATFEKKVPGTKWHQG